MSQRQQLERILEIDRLIRAGRHPNADRIARRMEVSRRVVFKDRDFMIHRLGAPIVYDRAHAGWAYSDPTFALPALMVTEGELLAFFLSVEVARRYLGTPFEAPLRSAVEKVRGSLRGPVTVSLDDLSRHFTLAAPAAAPADERVLLGLHQALRDRRRVAMRYFTASRRETSDRVVEPYHLVNQSGDWYLIAWDRKRRDFRYFHAGRIRSLKVLDSEPFARRKDFDPASWMRQAFQVQHGEATERVILRFDAEQAPYIRERVWHPTQQVADAPGGGADLSFETSGLGGVLRWVLQYGSHVEVLAPKALRKDHAREVKAMARRVRGKNAKT
jgi:predicted DNA-binding transcriptional regulator YafY